MLDARARWPSGASSFSRIGVRLASACVGMALAASTAWAQPPEAALLVRARPADGPQMTPYLRAQIDRAWAQDAERQARLDAVHTAAQFATWQAGVREAMLAAIGGLPETRTPLNARVVGSLRHEGYRVERVVFESLPGVHVTAVVYVPDAPDDQPPPRRPAVLLACGHATIGKAHDNYQRIAGRLARLGYVVICWDPIGQGERSQFWEPARGDTRYDRVCGEHAVLGNLATLAGASIARWMIWDGIRALDYLLTRTEVDPDRIAITGTSGGGFQSAWIGALDTRIAVVAPSAFITSLPMRMANRIFEDPDSDPEQDPPGLVAIDHVGLLLAAYPRRIHLSAVTRDFFPIEGTRLTFRRVRDVYARLGHGDRIAMSEAHYRHSYAEENQLAAFRFMARAFAMPVPMRLPDVTPLPADRLQVTPTGQVRVDLAGRSLPEVIAEYSDARRHLDPVNLAARFAEDAGPMLTRVEADQGQAAPGLVTWQLTGSSTWDGLTIDRYLLRHDGIQEVPVLHVRRGVAPARATVLHVDLQGKVTGARWSDVSALLADGRDVLSLDLPGVGETRMPYAVATHPYLEAMPADVRHAHPLSSVLANHVYNGVLTRRPYLIDAVRAVDVVATFARRHLKATAVSVVGPRDAATLAAVAQSLLPDLSLQPGAAGTPFDWADTVRSSRELWPIQYLWPDGARIRLTPAPSPVAGRW